MTADALATPALISREDQIAEPAFYQVFGLTLRSALRLPSLAPAEIAPSEAFDVDIRLGLLAEPIEPLIYMDMRVERRADGILLDIDESGRFLASDGRQIIVQPDPAAAPSEVHTYLLGSALGCILHQRGLLPLHANAVELDGKAYAFAGDSGAGKSTLAAHFQDRGFRLLSDDICLIDVDAAGRLVAWPGIPRLKLWLDALEAAGRSSEGLKTVAWTDDKFEIPLAAYARGGPFELAAIYHLREADDERPAGIFPLTGLDAVNLVTANTYRRRLIDVAGMTAPYLQRTLAIVRGARLFTVNRRWGYDHFETEAARIEGHMRDMAAR